ncbi:MAG TPA: hypothetical protein VK752_20080 [Bryobacteraceae bacterium]|jgi:hypothetical protein|nr:hypothetical protein [Bryobacteraceae bacterium]
MRFRALLVFLLLLIPSGFYLWNNLDMPEFGKFHDDGLLMVSAKSLATGHGFRIISLPEQPAQTKYPILYPLYLSIVWKLNPNFPENLSLARLLNWALLIACLALSWLYLRKEGFSEGRTMFLVALLGLNPFMILFGTNAFSEVFFTCWLLAVFLLASRQGMQWAILAGAAAGCAYLSRTAGIALLISMPAWYWWRRDLRRAIGFATGMIPFVLGWMLWSRQNIIHTADQTLIYYTDYVKYEFLTVGLDNLHIVLWKNIDGLLYGMGSLAIPPVFALPPVKILTEVVAIAMICGCVRLYRRGIGVDYSFFAILSSAMLIVWHFPSNSRFVLPLCPLLLAGLVTELEHLAAMLKSAFRHKDTSQRVAAYGMAGVVGIIILATFGLQAFMAFPYLETAEQQYRAKLVDERAAYSWIEANVPDSAKVLSNDDPILYLYTGHRGNWVPMTPRTWYADDHKSVIATYRNIADYCRQKGFEYFYSNTDDTIRWMDDPEQTQAVRQSLQKNPELTPLFEYGFGTVYKIAQPLPAVAARNQR